MQHCVLNDIFACTAVSLFFKERRVFGLIYSFGTGRLGSVLNLNLTGRLYSALSFLTDRNARLGGMLGSVYCSLGMCCVHKWSHSGLHCNTTALQEREGAQIKEENTARI